MSNALNIQIGKKYKTRDNNTVFIVAEDSMNFYGLLNTNTHTYAWQKDGFYLTDKEVNQWDLVEKIEDFSIAESIEKIKINRLKELRMLNFTADEIISFAKEGLL